MAWTLYRILQPVQQIIFFLLFFYFTNATLIKLYAEIVITIIFHDISLTTARLCGFSSMCLQQFAMQFYANSIS